MEEKFRIDLEKLASIKGGGDDYTETDVNNTGSSTNDTDPTLTTQNKGCFAVSGKNST